MDQNALYYPLMVNLQHYKCLVIGGGVIATRKVSALIDGHATSVTIVAPIISRALQQLLHLHESLTWIQSTYDEALVQRFSIVFAATDNLELNRDITEYAINKGILVCNVSDGEQGSFITPAVIREGQLTIAISTSGTSPSLTKHLKSELEDQFVKPYGIALQLMSRLRMDLERDGIELASCARITELALQEVLQVTPSDYDVWYRHLRQLQ